MIIKFISDYWFSWFYVLLLFMFQIISFILCYFAYCIYLWNWFYCLAYFIYLAFLNCFCLARAETGAATGLAPTQQYCKRCDLESRGWRNRSCKSAGGTKLSVASKRNLRGHPIVRLVLAASPSPLMSRRSQINLISHPVVLVLATSQVRQRVWNQWRGFEKPTPVTLGQALAQKRNRPTESLSCLWKKGGTLKFQSPLFACGFCKSRWYTLFPCFGTSDWH